MTQEEKQLLLIDLCNRLPHNVMVHAKWSYRETNGELKYKETDRKLEINDIYAIWDVKPYLRPMSSITNEEKKELNNVLKFQYYSDDSCMCESTDWLNAHHFDYRNLISMGLALEAPKNMYK